MLALDNSKDLYSIGKYLTEHLKVAGGYWSLTSLAAFLYPLGEERTEKIIAWLKVCQNEDGGFGGNIGHNSHMTSTHYAVLILLVFGRIKYFFKYVVRSTLKKSYSMLVVFNSLTVLSLVINGVKSIQDFLIVESLV